MNQPVDSDGQTCLERAQELVAHSALLRHPKGEQWFCQRIPVLPGHDAKMLDLQIGKMFGTGPWMDFVASGDAALIEVRMEWDRHLAVYGNVERPEFSEFLVVRVFRYHVRMDVIPLSYRVMEAEYPIDRFGWYGPRLGPRLRFRMEEGTK